MRRLRMLLNSPPQPMATVGQLPPLPLPLLKVLDLPLLLLILVNLPVQLVTLLPLPMSVALRLQPP